nr:reverse transcriptase domain-containing protein [Tanacetum cinerariifolium]
ALHSSEYVPDLIELEDHVPLHIPKHHEDLVPAEDETYILEMRAAVPSTYHSLLPSGTPPLLPIPLPVPSTSRRAEIPEADTPPRKRLLLTAPRPGPYGETRFRDTERRMMTALEMVNMRVSYQVDVHSRESSEFYLRHHDAQEDVLRRERLAYVQEMLETQVHRHEWQRQTADDFVVQHIMRTLASVKFYGLPPASRRYRSFVLKMAPKRTIRSTQVPPVTPAPTATTTTVTEAQLYALINQGVDAAMAEAEASRVRNGYGNNGSGLRLAQAIRECTYPDFLKCQPLNFKGTEGVIGLTQLFEKMESVFNISNCTAACQVKYAVCALQGVTLTWVEKYIGGVPDTIHDSVKATKPKTMQEAIEFATELMDKRIHDAIENKQKFEGTSGNNQNQPQQNKRQNTGRAYAADHQYNVEIADGRIIGLNTIIQDCTLNFLNHPFNIDLLPVELGSFDVIVGMDWLSKYDAVIACAEKLVRIPFGNEILTIRGEGSNERNESRLNIISFSKAQEYMSKGCRVFLANITSTKDEDKSKGKQLEDVPVV